MPERKNRRSLSFRYFEGLEIVARYAHPRQVVDEADPPAPVVERQERFGLLFLTRDFAAVGPEEPHAPLSFPERAVVGHAFEFDGDAAEGGVGVEDGDGERWAVAAAAIEGSEGPQGGGAADVLGPSIQTQRIALGRLDARACQDVVKIIEYVHLPGLGEIRARAGLGDEPRGRSCRRLRLDEAPQACDRLPLEA